MFGKGLLGYSFFTEMPESYAYYMFRVVKCKVRVALMNKTTEQVGFMPVYLNDSKCGKNGQVSEYLGENGEMFSV